MLWDGALEEAKMVAMDIKDNIKDMLRKAPLIYPLGASWVQTRRIEKEQLYYERRSDELGLSRDFSIEKVKQQLKERLSKRNIFPKPKLREALHIVYASHPGHWETHNILPALKKFAEVTTYYHTEYGFNNVEPGWVYVRDKTNAHFVEFIKQLHKRKPIDLILTYLSGREVDCKTIGALSNMGIVTCTFHFDDRLSFKGRFEGGRWTGPVDVCKVYDLNLTQAPESLVKYRVEGGIVVLWPLAANQDFFYPRDVSFIYDVSFVGTAKGNRKHFIKYLRKNGVNVETFGAGWSNGFIPNEKVPEIFSSSRINLNFGDIGYTNYQCGKIRDFEIPICGGLMLTTHNPHLSEYFILDREIFTYRDKEDCLRQIRRLLSDEDLCKRARKEARERVLREHTWENRIKLLLRAIGLVEEN